MALPKIKPPKPIERQVKLLFGNLGPSQAPLGRRLAAAIKKNKAKKSS